MKIWLNNLKEGDIFYHIFLQDVYKCQHLGDAHNMNFKMSRIKFKILDKWPKELEELFGNVQEAFVNQYVYDNEKEATAELLEILQKRISDDNQSIVKHQVAIQKLEENILENQKKLNNIKEKYGDKGRC